MIKLDPLLLDLMIENTLEQFDWDKTLKMMQAVNWTYGISKIPVTLQEIKEVGSDILRQATVNEGMIIETGGFRAYYKEGYSLDLSFVGESSPNMEFEDMLSYSFCLEYVIDKPFVEGKAKLEEHGCEVSVISEKDFRLHNYIKKNIVLVHEKNIVKQVLFFSENDIAEDYYLTFDKFSSLMDNYSGGFIEEEDEYDYED